MSSPIARLRVDSLQRADVEILRDVTWELGAGQHWAVLGPNGSGKTSLVRMLAGYQWPTSGTIEVLGETFGRTDLRELRKRIGFASAAFGDWFSPGEDALSAVVSGFEASVGLWREPAAAEWERAREALAALGALHLAQRPLGVLSQGERQRVLIARTLVHRPALLVLDEPCEGLDPLARDRLLADLARLAARPAAPSLVQVTHHLEEIGPWVSHALLLSEGAVVAQGPLDGVLTAARLGRAFGAPCTVERERDGRWRLRFALGGQE
jgi:iron complex transport system ATP-binding protein